MYQSRFAASGALAGAVTLSLFLLMHFLVAGNSGNSSFTYDSTSIRFGPLPEEQPVDTRPERTPPKPPQANHPPPRPQLKAPAFKQPQPQLPTLSVPDLNLLATGSGPYLGAPAGGDNASGGNVVPLVRIQPRYPARAAMAKVEGWVELSFTITPAGGVVDARVVDSQPPRIFDKEALRALLKWKFKPRVIDGVPVPQRATQRMDFRLRQ